MVSVRCTGLSIRCAALLAPAARQHPSPCRTSQNGCGIYPERWDSSFNLPKFNAFILEKAAYSGWCVCAGVSVHQYGSWAGLRHLCGSADPSGDLDRPVSGGPPPAGQTAARSCQEHQTPVGGKTGVKGVKSRASAHLRHAQHNNTKG